MKKRIWIGLLLVLLTSTSYSQVTISVQGGAGLTGITKSENYNANIGYRFGVGVDFPIDRTWSLQTGIQFLNRSYSIDEEATAYGTTGGQEVIVGLGVDSKMNALYLQLPIKVAAYLPLNDDCGLQFSAGPYIAYGIGGKSDLEWKFATHTKPNTDDLTTDTPKVLGGKESHDTFSKDGGLKRLDIGLSIGADFKYKRLFAGIGAEYGFLPIDKEFPKDIFNYAFDIDKTLVSPRNIGVEFHIGFCFNAGKR